MISHETMSHDKPRIYIVSYNFTQHTQGVASLTLHHTKEDFHANHLQKPEDTAKVLLPK